MNPHGLKLFRTNIPNLDRVLGGGIPAYSINIIAGEPGTGKTILAQQILFNYVKEGRGKGLYLATLSEPTVKVIRYMQGFNFFDEEIFGTEVVYQDIGSYIRNHSLVNVKDYILHLVEEHQPHILVIDSFKAIRDIAQDVGEYRHFFYDLSVRLAGARSTTFLVGEYPRGSIPESVEFAVADGIIYLDMQLFEGRLQRSFHVLKFRGCATELSPHPFIITDDGVQIVCPLRPERVKKASREAERYSTGIKGLDSLLLGGIQGGRSLLISGVSGTGKTLLALNILVHNAMEGHRGIYFSFEETVENLLEMGEGFGWNVEELMRKNLLKIHPVGREHPTAEEDLQEIYRVVEEFQPVFLVIDPLSPFLQKLREDRSRREKVLELTSMVEAFRGVGIFISDIPNTRVYGLSRFGVEETVVDGIILLTSDVKGTKRRRYIEVYKMRASDHIHGRYRFEITDKGLEVLHYHFADGGEGNLPSSISFGPLHPLFPDGVPYNSAWLIHGGEGLGKSTLAYHFAIEGLKQRESVLFVSTDLSREGVISAMETWDFLASPYIDSGQLVILHTRMPSDPWHVDINDPDRFFHRMGSVIEGISRPCRIIFDSITSLSAVHDADTFVSLMDMKNRLMKQRGIVIFDTLLSRTLYEKDLYRLIDSYDVVIDLYLPNWGEMAQTGAKGGQVVKVRKARGVRADTRPYPYTIRAQEGVILEERFYRG